MKFEQYQAEAESFETLKALGSAEEPGVIVLTRTIHAALGLAGEAGEVVDVIKKHVFGGKSLDSSRLLEEIGDVLWYLALLCNAQGLSLETAMSTNIAKLKTRAYLGRNACAKRDAIEAVVRGKTVEEAYERALSNARETVR